MYPIPNLPHKYKRNDSFCKCTEIAAILPNLRFDIKPFIEFAQ